MFCRQKTTHLNLGSEPALQPALHHSHHPGEEESHQHTGSCSGYIKEKKQDATEPALPT